MGCLIFETAVGNKSNSFKLLCLYIYLIIRLLVGVFESQQRANKKHDY